MFNPTARNICLVPPGQLLQDNLVEFHRNLLLDTVRTEAFRRAIERSVKSQDVVMDVGAGTGILSMFAANAGAKHVYGVEGSPPIAALAKKAVEANGLADRVTIIQSHSSRVSLPARVDVIVSECIGWMMYVGEMFVAVVDARERFLSER